MDVVVVVLEPADLVVERGFGVGGQSIGVGDREEEALAAVDGVLVVAEEGLDVALQLGRQATVASAWRLRLP